MPPGVIIKSRFVRPSAEKSAAPVNYNDFLNYMSRETAKQKVKKDDEEKIMKLLGEKDYAHFLNYMDNRSKTENLFTADRDELTTEEKRSLQGMFRAAQENRSIMWQNVISFDNDWLKEYGVIAEDGSIDKSVLMNAARASMKKLLKAEHLQDSAVWTASIHYNTDNLHIHFAITEPYPCREHKVYKGNTEFKGYMSKKSLNLAKSAVVNTIMGNQTENELINDLIRNRILESRKKSDYMNDPKISQLYDALLRRLPEDRSLWKYNMNAIKNERPLIDAITDRYIELYHSDDYERLLELLDIQQGRYNRAYGDTSRSYAEGKLRDLHARMGNVIFRELSASVAREEIAQKAVYNVKASPQHIAYAGDTPNTFIRIGRDLSGLLRAMDREYKNENEIREYEVMIEQIIAQQNAPVIS